MFLRVYCQSYDISCSWGSWFDVSCQDDIARVYRSATAHGVEEILTADYEGDLSYNALGGESMLYFLQSHWNSLSIFFLLIIQIWFLSISLIVTILTVYLI